MLEFIKCCVSEKNIAGQVKYEMSAVIVYVVDDIAGSPYSKAFLYEAKIIVEQKKKLQTYHRIHSNIETKWTNEKIENNDKSNWSEKSKNNWSEKKHSFNYGDKTPV